MKFNILRALAFAIAVAAGVAHVTPVTATVASATNRTAYAGDGTTTAFATGFYFLANADLTVVLRTSAGVETTQTITTHYTVTGAGNQAGGTVTMVTAPPSGSTLTIIRNPPVTQLTDLVANDPLPAETVEQTLDKQTMVAQRNRDLLNRSLRISDGFNLGSNGVTVAPTVDQVFGWGNSGLKMYSTSDLTSAQLSTNWKNKKFSGNASTTVFNLDTEPGSINNLACYIGGVRQTPSADYSLSGLQVTFTTPPPTGTDNVLCTYGAATTDVVTPADGSVSTAKIADLAVTTAKLADANVTTAKIADNAVTNVKAADMATNTVKARVTAGTGDPEDLAVAANQFPARASTGQLEAKSITDFGLSLVDDASASAARTTLAIEGYDYQAFTANGTWTKPSGFSASSRVLVEVWGAGGGGGSGASSGGGGGGAYVRRELRLSQMGATETITVGSGGAVDTVGGNSSVGSLVTAYGGGGSSTVASAGGGGGGGGRGVGATSSSSTGGVGGIGYGQVTAAAATANGTGDGGGGGGSGGPGGSSHWGGGGGGGGNTSANGGGSVFGGGGGGGGNSGASGPSLNGGVGGAEGVAGTAPGGGGGRNAAGARGEVRITVLGEP